MSLRLAVVCEAEADFRLATALVERVILEGVEWLEEGHLAGCSLWQQVEPGRPFLIWKTIPELAREAGIRARGHFDNTHGASDAQAARRALRFLKLRGDSLEGILLIRDNDRDARRRHGLEQARDEDHGFEGRVVIGLAHCKRESWVLAGYDPADADDEKLLARVRAELGFDPRTEAHELTAKDDEAKRSAKRILSILTRDDRDREESCWSSSSLVTLRDRGRETGLAEFLDEVRTILVPLLGGPPQESQRF